MPKTKVCVFERKQDTNLFEIGIVFEMKRKKYETLCKSETEKEGDHLKCNLQPTFFCILAKYSSFVYSDEIFTAF